MWRSTGSNPASAARFRTLISMFSGAAGATAGGGATGALTFRMHSRMINIRVARKNPLLVAGKQKKLLSSLEQDLRL